MLEVARALGFATAGFAFTGVAGDLVAATFFTVGLAGALAVALAGVLFALAVAALFGAGFAAVFFAV